MGASEPVNNSAIKVEAIGAFRVFMVRLVSIVRDLLLLTFANENEAKKPGYNTAASASSVSSGTPTALSRLRRDFSWWYLPAPAFATGEGHLSVTANKVRKNIARVRADVVVRGSCQ